MKYMLLIYTSTNPDQPPTCDFEDWQLYDKAMKDAGIFVSGHALQDLTTATGVQVDADGRRSITDGPFAETREILGGYDIIDVPDLDVALEWAARCPGSRDGGTVVVRPVAGFGD
ncbi:YciI family protein [Rhodococcus chondri]|uniref:YciI family protein n=1 Tax=Rhodococcus chondri TaxID=3065941 RepID=A0ABU7K0A2_9NOCA|nr:YciI family protein [Rhodococcus sp. CC-R104]MEE2035482.1 YciI family protein [Rhodococcus sp. CC-R104]